MVRREVLVAGVVVGATILVTLVVGSHSHRAPARSVTPACTLAQLEVLASPWQGVAGAEWVGVDVANTGPACRLGGYPSVRFVDARGDVVVARDLHTPFSVYAEPPARTITLASRGVATFGFGWGGNPVDGQRCVAVALADVRLDDGVGQLSATLPLSPAPCAGPVSVTPIERGAWPERAP